MCDEKTATKIYKSFEIQIDDAIAFVLSCKQHFF